jgi:hypothetical protein
MPRNPELIRAERGEEQRKVIERLRSLLTDRFELMFHYETREQQVYAGGGQRWTEIAGVYGRSERIRTGRGRIAGHAVGLGMLAVNLSNEVGRCVIDKTGLTRKYDFELKWTPEAGQPSTVPPVPSFPGGGNYLHLSSERTLRFYRPARTTRPAPRIAERSGRSLLHRSRGKTLGKVRA